MGRADPKIIAYVPIRPRGKTDRQVYVELLPLKDGGTALLAYTSIEELVRCWGPQQHWAGLDEQGLAEIKTATGYQTMLLDEEIPEELRRPKTEPAVATSSYDDDDDDFDDEAEDWSVDVWHDMWKPRP